MTWTKLPDDLNEDQTLVGLSDAAWRLYLAAVIDANRRRTDGEIPAARLSMIVPRFLEATAEELVKAGLLKRRKGDVYQVAGPLPPHQPTREAMRRLSQSRSEAGRRGAARRWGDRFRHGNGEATAMASAIDDGDVPF